MSRLKLWGSIVLLSNLESCGGDMQCGYIGQVEALQFGRRLRGGSQPIVAKASDGFLYTVKFADNPQGENLAFNESMGNAIYRACGLPGPHWAAVFISDGFLDRYPQCWIRTESGVRRPRPGWCFGSHFLGLSGAPLFEVLPGTNLSRVRNRSDFLKAWVVDLLCQHADNRQALFLEDESGWLDAYFIDHGHMFGGPRGTDRSDRWINRYLDPRIYSKVTEHDCNVISQLLKSVDYEGLTRVVATLPATWVTVSARGSFQRFLERASDEAFLRDLCGDLPEFLCKRGDDIERRLRQPSARAQSARLRSPILWSSLTDPPSGWTDGPTRNPRWTWVDFLRS
jgi:hypothetical protein